VVFRRVAPRESHGVDDEGHIVLEEIFEALSRCWFEVRVWTWVVIDVCVDRNNERASKGNRARGRERLTDGTAKEPEPPLLVDAAVHAIDILDGRDAWRNGHQPTPRGLGQCVNAVVAPLLANLERRHGGQASRRIGQWMRVDRTRT